MPTFQLLFAGALLAFVSVTGCASAPANGSAVGTCAARQDKARSELMAAIDANGACTTDSDCQSIAFASNCFDSCSRTISKSGAPAVEAAIARVNGGVCASYVQDGCPRQVPPCAPPSNPVCVSQRCQ